MTKTMAGAELADRINSIHSNAVLKWDKEEILVGLDFLYKVMCSLKESNDLDFASLVSISAVDYIEFFEIVYHLRSMRLNHFAVVKTHCYGRQEPVVPSMINLWRSADLQEREIWDLMGIHFNGHPNMKRILLWEGFPGHPLRKDFLR